MVPITEHMQSHQPPFSSFTAHSQKELPFIMHLRLAGHCFGVHPALTQPQEAKRLSPGEVNQQEAAAARVQAGFEVKCVELWSLSLQLPALPLTPRELPTFVGWRPGAVFCPPPL